MRMVITMCGMLLLAVMAKAETEFLKTLPADDFAAAGLQKLTPEELIRLEMAVQRYRTGEVAVVQKRAETKISASQLAAEKQIAAAETIAKEAVEKSREALQKVKRPETKAAEVSAKKQPGWFTALITLKRAGNKPEKEESLESRLVGDFRGWSGNTIFTLEDGTRWTQQNRSESYVFSPKIHSPKVKISPAAISGFWLEVEGVNLRVRVIPSELPEQK